MNFDELNVFISRPPKISNKALKRDYFIEERINAHGPAYIHLIMD